MAQCSRCAAFVYGNTDSDTGWRSPDWCSVVPQESKTDNEEQLCILLESVLFTLAEMDKCPQFTESPVIVEPVLEDVAQVDVPDTRDIYPASDTYADFAFDAARENRIFSR